MPSCLRKNAFAIILAVGMVVTGSFNTLSNKLADDTCGLGSNLTPANDSTNKCPDGQHQFNHPYVQSAAMFIGETGCLLVFALLGRYRKAKDQDHEEADPGFNKWVMALPALCDCCATSLMNVGLTMTYAPIFQMLRSSVVIFTGLFSVCFLGRQLFAFHWIGMFLVLIGLVLVNLSSLLPGGDTGDSASASNPFVGNMLVIAAQLVVAVQMVIEEKFVGSFNVPALQAVGLEGAFGCVFIAVAITCFYFIPSDAIVGNDGRFENVVDAVTQMKNTPVIFAAVVGNVVSIAFFNYFGISVTKHMSATTRMVLDTVRTFVIWGISLAIGSSTLVGLSGAVQVLGFVVMLTGTMVYNKIVRVPCLMHGYQRSRMLNFDADTSITEPLIADQESLFDQIGVSTDSPMYTHGAVGHQQLHPPM